ncbi:hypothetical protein ECDEC5A_0717 [Escherichia coli DEC5A]|nr:hypothetical protein ECDEC5A_0717 [Escherichia coli DEC5A]
MASRKASLSYSSIPSLSLNECQFKRSASKEAQFNERYRASIAIAHSG